MKRMLLNVLLVFLVLFSSTITHASAKPPPKNPVQSYLVVSNSDKIPHNIHNRIRTMGGKVKSTIPQFGVAVIEASDSKFAQKAAKIPGVQAVLPNFQIQWTDQHQVGAFEVDPTNPQTTTQDDYHFELQWNLAAINAPAAWAQGYQGQNVLVAVLDTGFDLEHPDLQQNIAGSISFVEGESPSYSLPNMFSHGTHVAGIIAAADNNIGTIGVAPQASLMLVKVLQDNGTGAIADVLAGMAYAADQKARVINMSFGAQFDTNGFIYDGNGTWLPFPKKDILEYRRLMSRAVTYANSKGALVVAAVGNYGWYRPSGSSILILPADAQNAIGVSATGPVGWAYDQTTSPDILALYSNIGHNLVDVAAPGGEYRNRSDPTECTLASQTKACWVFDMVISTGYSSDPAVPAYYWTAGTSMAAAHTSGVLALLIGKSNGRISGGQATTRLYQTADDLGPSGKDFYFGSGRVNAAKIIQ
jgi:lantibiotic leader peptide-processing serine protease